MTRLIALVLSFFPVGHLLLACSSEDDKRTSEGTTPSATETNVMPAPCTKDSNCGDGGTCGPPLDGGSSRFCKVPEMGVSSSPAPAPCTTSADCGDAIACVNGFCDVQETVVSSSPPITSATAAPCNADGDCPAGIACVHSNGTNGPGFCNVDEHAAP